MTYKIEIQPSGVHFQSEGNILDDALEHLIPLEHSCKTGECGVCSAEVVSGEVENEAGEVVQKGKVLTCQSKALSNVTLNVNYYPELSHQKMQTLPCKVASIDFLTGDIVILKLRFPPTAKFDFLPGQYIDLNFKGIKRSYSIANSHEVSAGLELHIRKVPNGKMSEVLFSSVKENQLMRIEGPKGTFFIRNNDKPLILIATGTGIAPIKAMVEELIVAKDNREINLFWGMQYAKELYCQELFKLSEQHDHIHFTPVLSQEHHEKYAYGHVQHAVLKQFDSLENMDVYACGSVKMINESKKLFKNHKLLSDAFYSDAFTAAK